MPTPSKETYLSIVLPDSPNVERCRRDIESFFKKWPAPSEVIVAFSGELGPALLRAQGEFVFTVDSNLSIPLVEVIHFLTAFREESDTGVLISKRSGRKNLFGQMGDKVSNFLFGSTDPSSPFKAYRRQTIAPIFSDLKSTGLALQSESLLKAKKLGFKIKEITVQWTPDNGVKLQSYR